MKILNQLKSEEPSAGLLGRIMVRISEEQKRLIFQRRLFFFSFIFLLATMAFVPVWKEFQTAIINSGILYFCPLIFSDLKTILIYWQDFGLSLLESLPIFELIAVLMNILALLWLARLILRYINIVFKDHNHISPNH